MSDQRDLYSLSIEPIPTEFSEHDTRYFPGYYVGSTAPNNVEDGVKAVENPETHIKEIANFFVQQQERELLIVIHGYNTSLGDYQESEQGASGVKGWYESIRNHISEHYGNKPKGLLLIGYRWSSEVIKGVGNDSFGKKVQYAKRSLPKLLNILLISSIAGILVGLISFLTQISNSLVLGIIAVFILSLALITGSLIFTLIVLRLSGYFRDSYRANTYGVPDLVELIRQLDQAIVAASPGEAIEDKERYWKEEARPIKLSFIGHSMGGFAVTNAVRVLSDVFDPGSIGSSNLQDKAKAPSSRIGHVFSLGRLILVSPDIPAEAIISGRANFLSSSLRRFEEAYLFSNEGDMALRLASTAANYFSFPARTRAGGYRLGNVVVRKQRQVSRSKTTEACGIVNLDETGQLTDVQPRGDGGFETEKILETAHLEGLQIGLKTSSFLNFLFVSPDKPLAKRQSEILLSANSKPIAELFTYFDCTDYTEMYPRRANKQPKRMGVLTKALGKPSLSFWDYVKLTIDFASGNIDTHGGYFNNGDAGDPVKKGKKWTKPEARFTKQLIYGLACLGFQGLLESIVDDTQAMEGGLQRRKQLLQEFSRQCEARGVQVLLAVERYNRDILQIRNETDRNGY